MSDTKHTPTPWSNNGESNPTISGPKGHGNIALALEIFMDRNTRIANANHIVKCVNMHDELVAGIKSALAALSQNATFPADIKLAKARLNDALESLAKASEVKP